MPRPSRGPYVFRRPDRPGLYAYVNRHDRAISLGTEDETEAQRRLGQLLESRRLRSLAPEEKALTAVFAECSKRAKTNHTPKTEYNLFLDGRRILRWLDARKVYSTRAVNLQLVEDYKTSRRFDGVGARRINRELSNWKKAIKIAVEQKAADESVYVAFVKLREPRPEPHQRGLTKPEIEAFFTYLPTAYRCLFRTVLGSGIRDDEMRHVDASDIRPEQIVVTPKPGWTTKSYRYRSIPVSDATVIEAHAFVKLRPKLSLDPKGLWRMMRAACEEAEVEPFSMHDLRRTWASHMLAAGYRIEQISQWLGHGEVMTTMRYLRVVDAEAPDRSRLPF